MRLLPFLAVPAVLALAAGFFACDDNTGSPPIDYTALLTGLTDDTTVPEMTAFATSADALVAAGKTLETDTATLSAMQTAWRNTRRAWRILDAQHFGPMIDQDTTDRVDTVPATDAIDAVVTGTQTVDATVIAAPAGAKGFLALEYVLFSDQISPRRATLARVMAEDLALAAHQLSDAWTGTFAAQVKTSGSGSARYATQRAALDDLVGAVGYAFENVVAVDLALPLGRKTAGRPDQTEITTRLSDNATADMIATLDGISASYVGRGFNVLVKQRSAALDTTFASELADCTAQIKALPAPFASTVVNATPTVQAAYDSCKKVKLTWTVDITSAVGATLKPADPDGD